MAVAQAARLLRWAGERTWREPILFVLHLGYAFVPLGALTLALSIVWPDVMPPSGALHAWTTGAMGTMTLAVMTRATLGHTGQALHAGPATQAIYACVLIGALLRVCAAVAGSVPLIEAGGALWIAGFAGYSVVYARLLVMRKPAWAQARC
jgi:uncharacterized protein involved in response to NO